MKAVFYENQGAAKEVLQYADIPMAEPSAGEVRVKIKHSCINPSDVKIRAGLRGPLAFPRVIPHSDGSGVIDAVGEGVSNSRVGESVWLYNAAFGRDHGTGCEYVCVPQGLAVAFDNNRLSFEAAATLGIAGQTAMAGILQGGDLKGKHVLVSGGAGAVGFYAVQFAKHLGAKVIVTVSSDAKADYVRVASPHAIFNYKSEGGEGGEGLADKIMAETGGAGIDLAVEVEFGGNLSVLDKVMAEHSHIASYGSEAVPEPSVPFYSFMFRNVTLHWLMVYKLSVGFRADVLAGLADYIKSADLVSPVANSFDLKDCVGGHESVEGGKMGHVLLNM